PSRGEVKAPGPWGLSPVSLGLLAPESGFLAAQGLSNVNASLEEAGYGGGGRTAAGPILLSWAKPRTGRLAPLNCGAAAGIAGPWQKSHPHRWRHPGGGQSLKIRLCQLQKRCHHEQKQWGQLGHRVTSQKDMDSYNTQLLHYVHVAINNMVRQCSPSTHGAPKSMDLFSKLDLIQEFMLDKMETVRFISLLMEPRVCWSGDSLKNPRRYPRSFRKCPRDQESVPRAPLPGTQTSECSSSN
uniref:Uncharacterized LOC103669876 n=1 Tax=Ursus maritimus TaxID=29073 RepID=A0A452TCF0_URSMA